MNDKTIIHVIDDDEAMRDSLSFLLDVNGFKAHVYESADAFLRQIDLNSACCVISDIRMPGMNGIELVKRLKGEGAPCSVILITGHGDVALAHFAQSLSGLDAARRRQLRRLVAGE